MAWIWFSRMKLRPKLKYIINYFIIYVAIEITLYAVILNHKLFYNEPHSLSKQYHRALSRLGHKVPR